MEIYIIKNKKGEVVFTGHSYAYAVRKLKAHRYSILLKSKSCSLDYLRSKKDGTEYQLMAIGTRGIGQGLSDYILYGIFK